MNNELKKNEKRLIEYLRLTSKEFGLHKIILNQGRFFSTRNEQHSFSKGKNGNCYGNCADIALNISGFFYCEGLAAKEGGFPNFHAWLVDSSGTVYEPTPTYQTSPVAYYGITFQATFIKQCILQTKYYGIFDNDLLWLSDGEASKWQDFIPDDFLIPWE